MGTRYEVRLSGAGGQGLILVGKVLAEAAAIYDGKNATQSQSYGPEARGGASRSEVKALEAKLAIEDGADELDMVMNIGKFLSGEYEYVKRDIAAVVAEAKPKGVLVKVILETALLTLEQVAKACELAIEAGADFVKTSTGFNGDGATPEAVEVMLKTCAGRAKVKPSGGIRDWDTALRFVRMGADRLGVGSADKILDGAPAGDGY